MEPPEGVIPMKRIHSILFAGLLLMQPWAFVQAASPATASPEMTLTNAYDAFGRRIPGLTQDFGFSTVVEYHGKTILFDSGTNARTLAANLKALKIDPSKIDIAIISHGHYDHVGGMDALLDVNPNVKIYAPADFFSLGAPIKFPFNEPEPAVSKGLSKDEQYFRGDSTITGMVTVPTGRFWKSNIEYVTAAREILPGVTLIPTTSSLMGTFIKYPPAGHEHPQFIGMPELSVAFATDKGDVLLSGCAHSSIEKIVQETLRIRNTKIRMVAGGFHLIPYGADYIEALAKRMHYEYGIASVAPAHCTGQTAFVIFRKIFGDGYRFFGLGETLRL
jgi:7,8-dihydropterin-6-yl-methyl-4-(beta-D-ribofuranosyl)aminobenzene 5'-phosphate synthase